MPNGRPRRGFQTTAGAGDGSSAGAPLFVCNTCWAVCGGRDGITSLLAGTPSAEVLAGIDALDTALADEAEDELVDADVRHPVVRLLMHSGVRWALIRWMPPAERVRLWKEISLRRLVPMDTRPSPSPQCWLAEVAAVIGAQSWQQRRKDHHLAIASAYAAQQREGPRPLASVAQAEIAAAVGVTREYVSRVCSWLRRHRLMHEVLPGTHTSVMPRPEDETLAERGQRLAREAAAARAEEAAMRRARAELGALRSPSTSPAFSAGDGGVAAGLVREVEEHLAVQAPVLRLTPVYELRVPLEAGELVEKASMERERTTPGVRLLERLRAAGIREIQPRNIAGWSEQRGLISGAFGVAHDGTACRLVDVPGLSFLPGRTDLYVAASATGRVAGWLVADDDTAAALAADLERSKTIIPPWRWLENIFSSTTSKDVEKRRASRGIDMKQNSVSRSSAVAGRPVGGAEEPADGSAVGRRVKRRSPAQAHADALLGGALHHRLAERISRRDLVRWLITDGRAVLAWSSQDLADHLHGAPEHPSLPTEIHNPAGWIRRQLRTATTDLPPSKRRQIEHRVAQLRADTHHARRTAATRWKRQQIDACGICDPNGYFFADPTDPHSPEVRCTHNLDTAGWT